MNKFFQPKFDKQGRMIAIILTEPVKIKGRDFFGRKAWLQFVPSYDYNPGWYWNSNNPYSQLWSIRYDNIFLKKRRICLAKSIFNGGKILINYLEHITALRMLGLDAVGISCGPGAWPPYLLAGELWEQLTPYLQYENYSLGWREPLRQPIVGHCDCDQSRSTSVGRLECPDLGLCINACIDFGEHGGPIASEEFFLGSGMDMEKLERIFYSATPGWPPKLYHLAKLAGRLGWPHNKRICLGNKCFIQHDSGEVWVRHRILDILGATGAVSVTLGKKSVISAKIDSIKGGHESDLFALTKQSF